MELNFSGLALAVATFTIIGLFHPIVVKTEYWFGTRLWWVFAIVGVVAVIVALFIKDTTLSALLGVFGASSLWSIGELFAQRRRVKNGWQKMNPHRAKEYED